MTENKKENEEFWKITELKKMLKISIDSELKVKVTRNDILSHPKGWSILN